MYEVFLINFFETEISGNRLGNSSIGVQKGWIFDKIRTNARTHGSNSQNKQVNEKLKSFSLKMIQHLKEYLKTIAHNSSSSSISSFEENMVDIAFRIYKNSSESEKSHIFVDKNVSFVNLIFEYFKTSKQYFCEELS